MTAGRIFRQGTGCLFAVFMLLPATAMADPELNNRLEQQLAAVDARFVGHEAVTVRHRSAPEKYLILDFQVESKTDQDALQKRIHSICTQVLSDQSLIQELSDDGYNMISVAFDELSQYDCL